MKKSKASFCLLVITDRKSAKKNIVTVVRECCKNGVKAIQLREKDLPSKELLELAKKIKSVTGKSHAKMIINDRLDIALLSGASGVHSPEQGISVNDIKKFGRKFIAGKSVHSVVQAVKAEKEGFDYILFGPVFRTASKIKYGAPQGLNKLKDVCSSVKIPVFAVGGVTPGRVKKCISAGAHGVAVIGTVMHSDNIKKIISEYKAELGGL